MPTVDEFKLRYPIFKETDAEHIGFFMEDAKLEINQPQWRHLYKRGVLALTAHLLTLNQLATHSEGEANRILASESAGELSVSYLASPMAKGDEFYQTTAYGQEYLRLRQLIGIGFMVV